LADSETIREPAVAGFFYPRSAAALADDIDRMIEAARPPEQKQGHRARVLVSPHAGYKYSGSVAAAGYRVIKGLDFHTVVVISPSHVERFGYSSVFDGGGYETPLGLAATSRDQSNRIAGSNDRVISSLRGHLQTHLPRQEHALEVQIPFLQRSLEKFKLVAIVMGDQSWDNCLALGDALAPLSADPGVLIVASTDLSHFYDAEKANRLDREFRDILSTLEVRAIYDRIETGRTEACGAGPVIAALLATGGLDGRSCSILDQKNSGDVTGDFTSVVGYLSAVVTAPAAT
jgi:AmmeMemoRadiSam system protein B